MERNLAEMKFGNTHITLRRQPMKTTLRLALILTLALCLGLAGCGHGNDSPPTVSGDGNGGTGNGGTGNGGTGVAGALDTSFGGAGIVTTDTEWSGYAMVIQGDGKILMAGSGAGDRVTLVRYNTDGSLDTGFGAGGAAILPAGSARLEIAKGLAIDSDGKIIVAGIGTNAGFFRMAAARLNPDGSLDTSFGTQGVFYSPFTSNGSYGAQGVAIQADGKIVLVGETSDRFAVVRLTTNGSLDTDATTGFGGGAGYVTLAIQDHSHARAAAIQDDGKIVVVGQSYRDSGGSWDNWATSVARFNSDGSLDTAGFGIGYIISPAISDPQAMALQNGKILVAGGAIVGSHSRFAMLRFYANGRLDDTFSNGGFVTTQVGEAGADATAYSMALSDDGIVLAGHVYKDSARVGIARYNADGGLDTTFGSPDGYVLTEIGLSPYPYGLAIDSDGKIVAAGMQGFSNAENPGVSFVARYLP